MRKFGIGLAAVALTSLALVAPSANAAEPDVAPAATTFDFPSADSQVVGSTGFIDGEQVGYFWSAARGDSVTETFTGKKKIKKAILKLDVPYNGLAADAFADWTLSINGKDVGDFTVESGQMGPITESYKFKAIKGKQYEVRIYMTNEVAGGAGAHTLRYAGTGQHSITLK